MTSSFSLYVIISTARQKKTSMQQICDGNIKPRLIISASLSGFSIPR